MDIEFIRELTKIIKQNDLYKMEYKSKEGDIVKILSNEARGYRIKDDNNFNSQNKNINNNKLNLEENNTEKTTERKEKEENLEKYLDNKNNRGQSLEDDASYITSSMIGTFYSKPSPDEAAFVKVGDIVSKGDTVCVIESMKLINDVKSTSNCEIIELLVKDEDIVEYGQRLFKVREIDG